MLGIDIGDSSIRVVNLRRRGVGFELQPPVEIPFTSDQASNPIALGEILADTLNRSGSDDLTAAAMFCTLFSPRTFAGKRC